MRKGVVLCAGLLAALAVAAVARAALNATASASQTLATASLAPPTALTATQVSCKKNQPPQISLSWTASTTSFTGGYAVYRSATSGSGYTQIGTVNAATTTFVDPSTSLGYTTTYYYVVDATYQAWTARSTQAQVTTLSKQCT